jgi:hypothetical protein
MDNLQLSPNAPAKGAVQRLDGGGLAAANLRYSLAECRENDQQA